MKLEKFAKCCQKCWGQYLEYLRRAQFSGRLDAEGRIYFPNTILITETPDHYIMELVGVSEDFNGLKIKKHKSKSTNYYFNQIDYKTDDPGTDLISFRFEGMIFKSRFSDAVFSDRLRLLDLYQRPNIKIASDASIQLTKLSNDLTFDGCVFVNSDGSRIRMKFVIYAWLVTKNVQEVDVQKSIDILSKYGGVYGVTWGSGDHRDIYVLAQFQSTYLQPGLSEPTIGNFLDNHPDFTRRAFGVDHFVYEPFLRWVADSRHEEKDINPDLMLRRSDGYYDICDLKLPLLDRNVTTGERERRRFVSSILEGVAQLSHYKEYFEQPENAAFAFKQYGIKVLDPKLILVVGNAENVRPDEISEASRMLAKVTFIDFDALANSYFASVVQSNRSV